MNDRNKTPGLYPALVLLALFGMGGCFFDADFGAARRAKAASGEPPDRSPEAVFREAIP